MILLWICVGVAAALNTTGVGRVAILIACMIGAASTPLLYQLLVLRRARALLSQLLVANGGTVAVETALRAIGTIALPAEELLLTSIEKEGAQRSGDEIHAWDFRVKRIEGHLVRQLVRGQVVRARQSKLGARKAAEESLIAAGTVQLTDDDELVLVQTPYR